jgi:hypothetical protein
MNTKTRRNISKESIACAVSSYPENGWRTRLWCSSFFLCFLLPSFHHLLISKASFLFFISSNFNLSYINFQSYFFLPFFILFSSLFLPYIVFHLLILPPSFFPILHFTIFSFFMLLTYSLTRFCLFIIFST